MSEDPGSTTLEIEVTARDPRWQEAEPQACRLARHAAEVTLRRQAAGAGFAGPLEASIVLADDALVRTLNRTYRRQDRPTNVLSFANGDPSRAGAVLLGDVVLARETVVREAEDQGKPLAAHLSHLVVHGVLHLLGFDHERNSDAERMEALEVSILADLGFADPYRVPSAEVEAG